MKRATKLGYTELLVWHAIKGRAVGGRAITTDRLIGQECALSPVDVRAARKALAVAELIGEARLIARGRVEADDELEITLLAPEPAAAS